MAEEFDNPFDNPMFCGRLGDLNVYLTGDPQDPELLWCDPTGLDQVHSPGKLVSQMIEAERQRHIHRSRLSEEDEEAVQPPSEEASETLS